MWAIMVFLTDTAVVFIVYSVLLLGRSAWFEHGKPRIESFRRTRVGIAEGLNARLGELSEGDAEAFESGPNIVVDPVSVAVSSPSQILSDGTFVVEGATVAHPAMDGGSLGWGRTDADSENQTPDGFVEDLQCER